MKKAILIILAISFYPFGCEAQTNGTLPNDDSCDTIFVEDPAWDLERETFNQMIVRLTEENGNLAIEVQNLNSKTVLLESSIITKDEEIKGLRIDITDLEIALAKKPDTIYETVYEDRIVEVMPKPTVDTVFVRHSNDDKANRKFFHHGSFDAPYPKDITFETKEFCMITVEFPDSLGTYRTLDQFKVKRIKDHENARTIYYFIN